MARALAASIVVAGDGAGRGIAATLRSRGYRVEHQAAAQGVLERVELNPPDLLLVSLPLLDTSIETFLCQVRERDRELSVIVAGAVPDLNPGAMMLRGVFECVTDPEAQPHRLLSAVGLALGTREEDRQLSRLRHRESAEVELSRLVGGDPSMAKVFHFVRQVIVRTAQGSSPTILLIGETGTGKGAFAKCIHYNGARRHRPFVQINCAAIPATLVESELFGYERGAFTDARRAQPGLFEAADGGTLFLDEIASLPLDVQAKLLVAIEDKRFLPIGGRKPKEVDVQLIAASQPTIRRMVEKQSFRKDLYHRLHVLLCELPPLRERGADRRVLAERFLEEICAEYGTPSRRLTESAQHFIERYYWPGNVRELRNQMERIVLLSDDVDIEAWHFERASGEVLRIDVDKGALRIELPPDGLDLAQLEREVIRQALAMNRNNVSAAARFLRISRQTLIYRLKKHNLKAG